MFCPLALEGEGEGEGDSPSVLGRDLKSRPIDETPSPLRERVGVRVKRCNSALSQQAMRDDRVHTCKTADRGPVGRRVHSHKVICPRHQNRCALPGRGSPNRKTHCPWRHGHVAGAHEILDLAPEPRQISADRRPAALRVRARRLGTAFEEKPQVAIQPDPGFLRQIPCPAYVVQPEVLLDDPRCAVGRARQYIRHIRE